MLFKGKGLGREGRRRLTRRPRRRPRGDAGPDASMVQPRTPADRGRGGPGPLALVLPLAFFALASLVCWALAFLSWNLFEKHFLGLKRFFPYMRGASV